jgi:hypothetical protein
MKIKRVIPADIIHIWGFSAPVWTNEVLGSDISGGPAGLTLFEIISYYIISFYLSVYFGSNVRGTSSSPEEFHLQALGSVAKFTKPPPVCYRSEFFWDLP